jgi:nucleotide-binding universal stress UspA family protein
MQRFKNALIVASQGVDHTELMRSAEHLAVTNQARLTVFDAVPQLRSRRTGIAGYRPEDLQQLIESDRRSELEAIARLAPKVEVDVEVATGTLFIEATRRIASHGHDLVMIAPDQPRGLAGLARASTTMHLLRKCPVPVWVLRPEMPADGDVLTAVGPFEEGSRSPLDTKLVEIGWSLSQRMGSKFHLVHGWRLDGESLLRNGRVRMPAEEVDDLLRREELMARRAVSDLLAAAGVPEEDTKLHILKSRPFDAIAEAATAVDPGVVVMGTLARSGVAGLLMGNTAETTLGTLRSSIIAVKPEGFVSPITTDSKPGWLVRTGS